MTEAEDSLENPKSITTQAEGGIDQQHYTDSASDKFLNGDMQTMFQIITQSHLGTSGRFLDGVVQKMSQIITQPRLATSGRFLDRVVQKMSQIIAQPHFVTSLDRDIADSWLVPGALPRIEQ